MSHIFCLLNIPSPYTNDYHALILSFSIQSPHPILASYHLSLSSAMIPPELEKPRVTEIKIRMDCNGCVQKIKKALHGINGIYDIYIDFPQQKLTIIGWADLEKIVKAIKKTRKIATICTHTEPPTEPAPESGPPPPEPVDLPPPDTAPPPESTPPAEPPQNPPAEPPEIPLPEPIPPSAANDNTTSQAAQPSGRKDVEEVHVIHHHPPDYGYKYGYGHTYGGNWNNYANSPRYYHEPPSEFRHEPPSGGSGYRHEPPSGGSVFQHEPPSGVQQEPPSGVQQEPPTQVPRFRHDRCSGSSGVRPEPYSGYQPELPQPVFVTHSYNTFKPSPYVTEYEYTHSPPNYTHYSRRERYNEDYHSSNNGNGNGNITSMFSEENPNACRIV